MDASIGIFDSGLGGLTVFREIAKALPQENLIYVGDTARVPYGVKSAETITRYSKEICDFLLGLHVKAIVVACNTASALALSHLDSHYPVPLLGVLEPGAQAAVLATKTQSIGVIGTEGTIRSQSYALAIQKRMPKASVVSRACPLFVPLVEEGWVRHEVTQAVTEIYLRDFCKSNLDTLILGCTHYPLLKEAIQGVLGKQVTLVDSAFETAKALHQLLETQALLTQNKGHGKQRFFTTDSPEKFNKHASLFLGHDKAQAEFTNLGIE